MQPNHLRKIATWRKPGVKRLPVSQIPVVQLGMSGLRWSVSTAAMRGASDKWELEVSEAVQNDEDLSATVKKLEEQYDNRLIEEQEEK